MGHVNVICDMRIHYGPRECDTRYAIREYAVVRANAICDTRIGYALWAMQSGFLGHHTLFLHIESVDSMIVYWLHDTVTPYIASLQTSTRLLPINYASWHTTVSWMCAYLSTLVGVKVRFLNAMVGEIKSFYLHWGNCSNMKWSRFSISTG